MDPAGAPSFQAQLDNLIQTSATHEHYLQELSQARQINQLSDFGTFTSATTPPAHKPNASPGSQDFVVPF